jgi:hypothetical protein
MEDERNGASGTRGEMTRTYRVPVGKPEGRRVHLEDLGVDGRIILKWNVNNMDLDWINLAKDRNNWQVIVNTVMKRQVHWRTQRGVWGVQTPPPKLFRSFDKAEPNSQFREKYILRT